MQANDPTSTTTPATTDDTQSSADAADRRSFLKGAALVAGAAATGVFVTASEADAAVRPRAHATVRLGFNARPSLRELQAALEDIVNQAGCPTCGLGGFDIHLETIIPLDVKGAIQASIEGGSFVQ
jgi:hypothetical protein